MSTRTLPRSVPPTPASAGSRPSPITVSYALFVTAWTLARFTPFATVRPFEIADLFAWGLFVPLPVLGAVAVLRRRPRALVWLALPALAFALEYGPAFLPQTAPQGAPLRVASANLFFYNERAAETAAALAALDADVLVLHELGTANADAVVSRIGDAYPHRVLHARADALGMGVLSRLPLRERRGPALGRAACSCFEVTVRVGDRDVVILPTHLLPPGHTPDTADPELQTTSVRDLLARIDGITEPLVVAGDLNIADRHRFFRELRTRLGDAHRDAGAGFGFTFPARFPVLRIDHVLHDESWATKDAWTGDIPGSDHRYVVADLVLTG